MADIAADLNIWKSESETAGEVHAGFKGQLDQVWDDVQLYLGGLQNRRLYVTGHSLGGAMATICASRLAATFNINVVALYTYGSPRVGDQTFVDNMTVKH